jgi:hypothetical protein
MCENNKGTQADKQDKQETQCRYCKNIIEKGATICHHCSSHQDWKRFVNFSNIFLSLLIALLSVSALTIPTLKKSLWNMRSKVEFIHINSHFSKEFRVTSNSIFNPTDYSLDIVAINSGDGMGFISDAYLLSGDQKYHLLINDSNKRILAPNSFTLVQLTADLSGYMAYGYERREMKVALEKDCFVLIDLKQVSGEIKAEKIHLGKLW